MGLKVGTGKATESNKLLEALQRGRHDHQFFSRTFLNRGLHDGQLEYAEKANATINVLATANRYGKTTLLSHRHYHKNIYKIGAEPRYLNEDGSVDTKAFVGLKYQTVHTAGEWETAALVHEEAMRLLAESAYLQAFVKKAPRSKPPHIEFHHGAKWKFRTLGHDASGIDGNSYYHISIDEAGWIQDLDEKMRNVIRVRVADVRGTIDIVGTFKPGISKDFYRVALQASARTGLAISFDHRDGGGAGGLDGSIRRYLAEYGIDLSEYEEALRGQST